MLQFFQGAKLTEADRRYSVYDFYYRVKKIEKVCAKEELDEGILIITGIDSRENSEYTKLLNWVLFGHQGVEIESNEYLDAVLSDLIILVTPTGTRVYADRQGWDAIKKYFTILPNLRVFVPSESEDENKDESELLKMKEFLNMMEPIKKVGVLLGNRDAGKLKHVEKWPLIQAYAIQELGRGFFSMYHKVIDITARINQLYKAHDKHSLKNLANVVSKKLMGHTSAAVGQLIDVKMPKRAAITEEQLSEVFQDTFEIEEMNKFLRKKQNESQIPQRPRVLIGEHTNFSPILSSSATSIRDLGLNADTPPLHLTVEAFDLLSSLRCARTYMLSRQVSSELLVTPLIGDEGHIEEYQISNELTPHHLDEVMISQLYVSIVVGFNEAISGIAKDYRNLTIPFIQKIVHDKIVGNLLLKGLGYDQNKLSIWIGTFNSFGEEAPVNFKDTISFKLTPYFFVIRIQYLNIMSQTIPSLNLGSVLFAESFILQENCFFILTKAVPYLNCYNIHHALNSVNIEGMKKRVVTEELGKQLSEQCDKNHVFFPHEPLAGLNMEPPLYVASYILHEKGIRIGCDNLGWIVLLFDQLEDIEMIIGAQFSHSWILCTTKQGLLFQSLGLHQIALEFTGSANQNVLFPLQKLFEAKASPIRSHQLIPKAFLDSQVGRSLLQVQLAKPQLQGNQVVDSDFLFEFLESKQMTILNQMKDLKMSIFRDVYNQQVLVQQESRYGLILITGSPSSGKRRFASNLQRYAGDCKCQAVVLDFGLLEQAALTEQGFIQKLKSLISEGKRPQTAQRAQQVERVCLCVVPFFLNLDTLLSQIELVPQVYIRCVVNRINVNYFTVREHSQITRSIVPYSLPGYCQIVILDTYNNSESDVDDTLKTLRNILPSQQIIRTTNNIIYIPIAQSIYTEKSYNTPSNALQRTKLNVLRVVQSQTSCERLFVHFKVPFKQQKTRAAFKGLFAPPKIQVMHEKKLSQDEQDLLRLLEIIKSEKQVAGKTKLLHVKGYLRYEENLKQGLVEFTANDNYVCEREVRNIDVRLKEVTSDGLKVQDADYIGWNNEEDFGFLFCGTNLSRDICLTTLHSMCRGAFVPKPYLTRKDLSNETIAKIEFDNRGKRLDHGYFYDGCMFRDEDGMILPHHPRIDDLIEDWLQIQNQVIAGQNEQMKKEFDQYLKVFR